MINVGRTRKYLGHQFVWVNLLAFVLPMFRTLTPGMIVVFAIMVLFQSKLRIESKVQQRNVIWFGAIYLFYLLGSIWTENVKDLSSELETKLSLLVFPILFIFTKPLPRKVLNRVLLNFIFGCLINVILCTVKGVSCFLDTGDSNCLFSSSFAYGFHPSYLAMYFNLALAILIYFDAYGIRPYKIPKAFIWVFMAALILANVMLASKMGILTMITLFGFALVLYWRTAGFALVARRWLPLLLYFVLCLLISPGAIDRFKSAEKGIAAISDNKTAYVQSVESTSARIYIWKEAITLVQEKLWFGVGTGDVSDEMQKRYEDRGMTEAAELHLNCHNQFLETQIAIGIFGTLSLLSITLFGAYIGFVRKNFIYLFFSVLLLSNFLVESMLETQAGVVFFTFFNCLFFVQINQLSHNESNHSRRSETSIREGSGSKP